MPPPLEGTRNRRRRLAAGLDTAVLVGLAIPALSLDTGTPSTSASLPQEVPVVQTYNRVQEACPQKSTYLDVVVQPEDVITARSRTRSWHRLR